MKYKDAVFDKWQDIPTQDVFDDWVEMRKFKRAKTTATAIKGTAKWVNLLVARGYTADDCLTLACENCWQGMQWVFEAERKSGFPLGRHQNNNVRTLTNERITNEQFIGRLDPDLARRMHDQSPCDMHGVETVGGGRPKSVVNKLSNPAAKRDD